LHPDLKTAIELQQVDLRIAELSSQIEALPSQIQTLETQLRDFLQAYEDGKHQLAQNQKARRDLEGEIQLVESKITKHKDQLYLVKTNEQYRALLHEIEGEEANIRKIEDKILEKMVEAEQVEKQVKDASARLDGEKARVAREVQRLKALGQSDETERSELGERREVLTSGLSETTRVIYERVRKGRRGVAVAQVRDGFCAGCNVRLRPQAYNEVRTNSHILTCETCSRILYYVESSPAENKALGDSAASERQAVL